MLYDTNWWGGFEIGPMTSYFVSGDGRFAAQMGMFAALDKSGNLRPQPGASLLAFANEKLVWVYDYYGGVLTESVHTEPVPPFPPSGVQPGSPAAQTAIAGTTATIEKWLAAYNDRDTEAFLSAYAEGAEYTDVVSPDWRVMTKSQLAADVASHFPRAEFQSRLEASPGSPGVAHGFLLRFRRWPLRRRAGKLPGQGNERRQADGRHLAVAWRQDRPAVQLHLHGSGSAAALAADLLQPWQPSTSGATARPWLLNDGAWAPPPARGCWRRSAFRPTAGSMMRTCAGRPAPPAAPAPPAREPHPLSP